MSLLDELCMSAFGLPADQCTKDTPPLRAPDQPVEKKQKTAEKKTRRRDSYVPPKYKSADLFKESPCCKTKKCSAYFTKHQVASWRALREREDINVYAMQEHAMLMWNTMLVPNGKKCCVKFFSWVFGFSNNTIYYQRMGGVVSRSRDASRVDTSVMGWFMNLKEMLDCMPDVEVYQIAAPLKRDVHKWSVSPFCLLLACEVVTFARV